MLYGLNWAKGEIVARGEVVICEGYTDVMAFALAGAPNAVATCGTALADEHFQILKNLARKVVLAYDSDAAGQGAAEKWYRWEQRYEIQLQVADLPAGRTPPTSGATTRSAARVRSKRATPFLAVPARPRARGRRPRHARGPRPRGGGRAADIVAEHPSDLVRDQYVMKLAGELDIDADRLRDTVARHRKEQARRRTARRPPASPVHGTGRRRATSSGARQPARARRAPVRGARTRVVVDWLDDTAVRRSAHTRRVRCDRVERQHPRRDRVVDGPVRDLLERVAVEEPIGIGRTGNVGGPLMANTIGPAAQRVLAGLLRASDHRATSLKLLLDVLAHAGELGDWEAVQEDSFELLGWLGEGTRGAGPA